MEDGIACYTGDSIITGYTLPQCSELVATEAPTWLWWWAGSATTAAVLMAALVTVLLLARRSGDAD